MSKESEKSINKIYQRELKKHTFLVASQDKASQALDEAIDKLSKSLIALKKSVVAAQRKRLKK